MVEVTDSSSVSTTEKSSAMRGFFFYSDSLRGEESPFFQPLFEPAPHAHMASAFGRRMFALRTGFAVAYSTLTPKGPTLKIPNAENPSA